jgi:hypothetical protein
MYQIARPNHFEGAGSVILTPDRRFLFATNGSDIPYPASPWVTTAGSRCWTSSGRGTQQTVALNR